MIASNDGDNMMSMIRWFYKPFGYVFRGLWNFVKLVFTPFSFLVEPLFEILAVLISIVNFLMRPVTFNIAAILIIYTLFLGWWWFGPVTYWAGLNYIFFDEAAHPFNIFYYYVIRLHWFFLFKKLCLVASPFFYYIYINITTSIFYLSSYFCPVNLSHYYEWYIFMNHKYKTFLIMEWFNYQIPMLDGSTVMRNLFSLFPSNYDQFVSTFCPTHWNNPFSGFYTYFFSRFIFFLKHDYVFICFINLLIVLPLICLSLVFSIGLYGCMYITLFFNFLFWLVVVSKFEFFFLNGGLVKVSCFKWFNFFGYKLVMFDLNIDTLSYSYILLTLTIAVFVLMYTFAYFKYEPHVERLIFLINSFVASMILLVSGGNVFVLYLGWELIGITSFFLINFWSTKISTLKAAFKAFAFNKLSDVALLFCICILFYLSEDGNLSFLNIITIISGEKYVLFSKVFFLNDIISFLLLVSAFIKSAQFGFHIWLPDSMEAPVPASALIHSATLVSAGVYLVLRFSNVMDLTIFISIIFFFGLLTAFIGGAAASYQSDAKRTLAYSTISHCGFLMVACFFKSFELSVFYLYVHGFFKALIFMCVGNVLRVAISQDTRVMGGFWKGTPFEFYTSIICLANLSGSPFTLGFFMKHFFLITAIDNFFKKIFALTFILLGALAGLIYCYRLFYNMYLDLKKGDEVIYLPFNRVNNWTEFNASTPQGSLYAISSLLFSAGLICFYMFLVFFTNYFLNEVFENSVFSKNQILSFSSENIEKNLLLSYINYIIVFFIFALSSISWRFSSYPKLILGFIVFDLCILFFIFLIF